MILNLCMRNSDYIKKERSYHNSYTISYDCRGEGSGPKGDVGPKGEPGEKGNKVNAYYELEFPRGILICQRR